MNAIPRPILWSAAVGLIASFVLNFGLIAIDAHPMPFLLITTNLMVGFAAGLYMRGLYTYDSSLKMQAVGLSAIVAPLTIFAGMALSLVLAQTLNIQAEGGLLRYREFFEPSFYVFVAGGALVGAWAAWASVPWLFLSLPLALYFAWIILPTLSTGYIAVTNWDGIQRLDEVRIVGARNFERMFNDNNFWIAFGNNLKWLAFFITIPTSMGLAMAMIFNGNFPGNRIFKIAFYSPLVIAPAVVALVWESLYRPQDGLINSLLRIFAGPEADLPGWLADPNLVLWCIIVAAAWRQVGYVMILYLAGLKSLDVTLIEAATVDGATPWQRFRHVIFPLLGPVTVVVIVISVIDSLRAFDLVAIMTRGGPGYASEVLANFMYMRAFNDYRMGYAGAIAVVLLLLMLVFIVPYLIHQARTELEY